MSATSTAVRCPACNAHRARVDAFFYAWRERLFHLHRCGDCTHQFLHPPVTREDQELIYGDGYFSAGGDWVCGVFGGGYLEAEPHLREEAAEILGMLPAPPARLLDVGCAGGTFLDEARSAGFQVSGIELNASMAKQARTRYGLEVLCARVEDVPLDQWQECFDVVTLLDVLEHVPEPHAAVATIARWIRPGGHLLVRGPLSNSPRARLKESLRRALGIRKQLPGYPLDANTFNKRSLSRMLDLCGFTDLRWIRETPDFANLLARRR